MEKITKWSTLEVRRLSDGNHKLIMYKDMVMIETNGNGIKMKVNGVIYTHGSTMEAFMVHIGSLHLFCRAHKSYIINKDKVDTWNNGTLELYMLDGARISFSVEGLAAFKLMLKAHDIIILTKNKLNLKVKKILPKIKKIVPLVKKAIIKVKPLKL